MPAERRKPGAPRPEKTCPVCGRPFQWRKKWERDWDRDDVRDLEQTLAAAGMSL